MTTINKAITTGLTIFSFSFFQEATKHLFFFIQPKLSVLQLENSDANYFINQFAYKFVDTTILIILSIILFFIWKSELTKLIKK